MRCLDLCCGLGGWSEGFAAEGFQVEGIDNRDLGYPYRFIHKDIFDWNPAITYDVIVASPPCSEFSTAKYYAYGTQKERQGLDLVQRVLAIIQHCKPRYWIMENVKHLADFIGPPKKIVPYNKFPGGKKAYLWGNFPDFQVTIDGHRHDKYGNSDPRRAKIPIELSRAVARACLHKEVVMDKMKVFVPVDTSVDEWSGFAGNVFSTREKAQNWIDTCPEKGDDYKYARWGIAEVELDDPN